MTVVRRVHEPLSPLPRGTAGGSGGTLRPPPFPLLGKEGGTRAFTLVEVMVAVALLSVVALGMTTTLVGAQRARARSEQWMQATVAAVDGLEQLRAGHALGPLRDPGRFERSASVSTWNGHPGLYRLEVTVSWDDGTPQRFRLTTLARR